MASAMILLRLSASGRLFNGPNLLLRQLIQLIHQPIDLAIRRVNLTLNRRLARRRLGTAKLIPEVEHLINEGH